jgi:hypothetical protein
MPIFTQKNNSCYFIHIPRTGGRYISSLFESSNDMICEYHKINSSWYRGVDSTHLHYPLYNYYLNADKIHNITVVRDPYEKFLSCISNMSAIHNIDYVDIINDEDSFVDFIIDQIEILSFHNNWFLPQKKFISKSTYIWKYEWGFTHAFRSWVYDRTNIILKDTSVNYKKIEGEETKIKLNLPSRFKSYVRNFYKEDYEIFQY